MTTIQELENALIIEKEKEANKIKIEKEEKEAKKLAYWKEKLKVLQVIRN
jgi:hypothetical protein